jgi:hypothetical protein
MRAMHAVKVPHAEESRPEVGRDVLEFVKDEHQK